MQILLDLLRKKHITALQQTYAHIGHFPDNVRSLKDFYENPLALRYCHNNWCEIGQINLLMEKLETARDRMETQIKRELDPIGSYIEDVKQAVKEGRVCR